MNNRRNFIRESIILAALIAVPATVTRGINVISKRGKWFGKNKKVVKPLVISTWRHGLAANETAYKVLKKGGRALDAVEQGVRVSESDPNVHSVGYGGLPDRDGYVTLDACIMDEKGNCGSVAYLQHIKNPISIARMVMEETPHIMLAGKGALEFALSKGYKKENLLTEEAKDKWEDWMRSQNFRPEPDEDNHDTIGMIAIDNEGNLSGACTTSGLAWKYHGRVGDSPIIGAGLFVDNDIGAAVATGKGEAVIKIAGTHLIVEMMRNGKSPQEACELAIERIVQKQPDYRDFQVGFLALNKYGEYGSASIQKKFEYARYVNESNIMFNTDHYLT